MRIPGGRAVSAAAVLGWAALAAAAVASAAGVLLDERGEAVPDATVVMSRDECTGAFHCNLRCTALKVTRTDARGRYEADLFRYTHAYVYKRGYVQDWKLTGSTREPAMRRGSSDARFQRLDPVTARIAYLSATAKSMKCLPGTKSDEALVGVYKEMLREALDVGQLVEHRALARRICVDIARLLPENQPGQSPEAGAAKVVPECAGAKPHDPLAYVAMKTVQSNDDRELREFGGRYPDFDFNRRADAERPLIRIGAEIGANDAVRELARLGARPDDVGVDGRTALDVVLSDVSIPIRARREAVRALLDAGADPSAPDLWGYPPLAREAGTGRDPDIFRLLLDHGARVDGTIDCESCSARGLGALDLAHHPEIIRIGQERGVKGVPPK